MNTTVGVATFASRNSGASLSSDGRYRYELTRRWDNSTSTVTYVMLNPSTADASVDDPTIRRCIGFAQSHGFGGLRVLNLYAFRATQPKDMFRAIDPVGPENDTYLGNLDTGSTVVAAWGAHARPDRVRQAWPTRTSSASEPQKMATQSIRSTFQQSRGSYLSRVPSE